MRRFGSIPAVWYAHSGRQRAAAHRLDEYLQATLIGIAQGSVVLEIRLTPGVAVLPVVMSEIDRAMATGAFPAKKRAYLCGSRVVRDVELRVDGRPASLSLVESTFPALDEMRQGLGTIRLKLRASGVDSDYAGT